MRKKEQSPKTVKKKLSKKKKKFLRGVVYAVFITFLLGLIFLIGYGIYYLRNSERFNVTKVVVNELTNYTSEEIINISEIPLGENIFKVDLDLASQNILTLPYVEEVDISKDLPSILEINITERTPKYIAYAKDSGQYVKIDSNGYVLEIVDVSNITGELILFGLNFEDIIELGYKLTDAETEKLNLLEKVLNIYNENEISAKITSVEFKNLYIILNLNDKLSVYLKDNNQLEYKISFLKTILGEIDGKTGVLDMTQENPTFSAI